MSAYGAVYLPRGPGSQEDPTARVLEDALAPTQPSLLHSAGTD